MLIKYCKSKVMNVVIRDCICARGLSVTMDGNDVRNGVLFSEFGVLKLGTSCVVYNHNHTLGRMWT